MNSDLFFEDAHLRSIGRVRNVDGLLVIILESGATAVWKKRKASYRFSACQRAR